MKTNKILAVILAVAMMLSTMSFSVFADAENWIDFADTSWYDADTSAQEYTISTAEQLAGLAKLVNEGAYFCELGPFDKENNARNAITIKLGADIDLAGKTWTPIGETKRFIGKFDGCDYTISNINATGNANVGLFGMAGASGGDANGRAGFSNLKLHNVTLSAPNGAAAGVVGNAFVGNTFNNIHVTGLVNITAKKWAGGIVGYSNSKIENCSLIADEGSSIYSENEQAGGIVAFLGEGSSCSAKGCKVSNVSISSDSYGAGGISGWIGGAGEITGCEVSNVTVDCDNSVGYISANAAVLGTFENNKASASTAIQNDVVVTAPDAQIDGAMEVIAYSGAGTQADPIKIYTLAQLVDLANQVNSGKYANKYIYVDLMADIDVDQCNDESLFPEWKWIPIGTSTNAFQGEFNGNDHIVSNLWIDGGNYIGFFGQIGNNPEKPAVVKDLTLANACMYPKGEYAGVLAGRAFTLNAYNVKVTCDELVASSSSNRIGGFVGGGYAMVENCHFVGDIEAAPAPQVGGLLGSGQLRAYDSSVIGDVIGGSWVGGLVGNGQESTSAVGCYVEGTVTAENNYYFGVGGIAGVGGHGYSGTEYSNNYFNGEVYLKNEKVNTPLVGFINEDNAKIKTTISGNSWNADYYPADMQLRTVGTDGLSSNISSEDYYQAPAKDVAARNNLLVATESDLDYLGDANIDDIIITTYASNNGVTVDDVAVALLPDSITVKYEKVDVDEEGADTEEVDDIYNIILSGEEEVINRLNSADLTFAIASATGLNAYEIVDIANDNITFNPVYDNVTGNVIEGRYEFHFEHKDGVTNDTAADIVIAQVKISGYGEYSFGVTAANENAVHTTTIFDNIVDTYVPGGAAVNADYKDLIIDNKIEAEIIVPKRDLTIKVDFPNNIEAGKFGYQDMRIIVEGPENYKKTIELGDGFEGTENLSDDGCYYQVVVEDELTLNSAYTVTVEGAGYRTAKYTVSMTENKTLNFWNNVKDNDTYIEVSESGVKKNAVKTNFLAGDIVKDNNINVYDLSAVVSYFGEINLDKDNKPQYAKYDLNRDGKVDSKDVAYVLVSWGN